MKLLERVVVAAPCPLSWDMMDGDDKVRHCSGCSRNVYNLSMMSEQEAESFLQINGASQCVTFYRRADGMIMTDNCPKGLKAIRDRVQLWSKVAAGFLASVLSIGSSFAQQSPEKVQHSGQGQSNSHNPPPGVGGAIWIPPAKDAKVSRTPGQASVPGQTHVDQMMLGEPMVQPTRNSTSLPPGAAGGMIFVPPTNNGKKTVIMPTDCKSNPEKAQAPVEPISGDKAAYNLFTEAQNSKVSGKDLVALTQFKSALNMAKGMKNADPQFTRMIESEIATLQSKLHNK